MDLIEAQIRLGAKIREVRKKRGLTLPQLAAKAGLSNGIVSKLENGKSNPSLGTLKRLAIALQINIVIRFQ